MEKVIAIVGPTGSGKSDLAVWLAQRLNGEVISADSVQVYNELNIGSAKITPEEMQGIEHHLINIQSYKEMYNVKLFQENTRKAIEEVLNKGKIPILCGGTGLYLKAALYDYEFLDEEPDPEFEAYLNSLSTPELYGKLLEVDRQATEKIHPNNRKRILRALVMAHHSMTKSQRENAQKHEAVYDVYFAGIEIDKDLLDEKIEQRVEKMFEQGLVEEVTTLFKDPATWNLSSFQGIGYKEFRDYFEGKMSLDQVKEWIVIHTRQYAKRQMTWFRHQIPVHWFTKENREQLLKEIEKWMIT